MGKAARVLEAVPVPTELSDDVRSIQGEQQEAVQLALVMPQEDVDKYISTVDDLIIQCRERGRHMFMSVRKGGLRFEGQNEEGLLIRRERCSCCQLAVKVELWDVRHNARNKVTRCELVTSRVEYRTEHLPNGNVRRYPAPSGRGRVYSKAVRNAVGTAALAGMSYTELLKTVKKTERERAELSAAG